MILEVKKTTSERLRDLADFLDEHGIGMDDHSDRPLIEDAANAIDRMKQTIDEVHAAIIAGGLMNYIPLSPGSDATVSLAECVTAAATKIADLRKAHIDEYERCTKLLNIIAKNGEQIERLIATNGAAEEALKRTADEVPTDAFSAMIAAADELVETGYAEMRGLLSPNVLRYRLAGIIGRHLAGPAGELARLRAALTMLAQIRHVSGSAQGAFRSNLRLVDAVLAGADVRDLETVEAIAAGTWKPKQTKEPI